ncbi:MAG: hypothetical protein NT113_15610 [Hyphomicrobiales bacterium]|nr:hypothetical protein [Hyphomicrobiales bacterium]
MRGLACAVATIDLNKRTTEIMDDLQISALIGRAALKVWADLPAEAQEWLFKAAVADGAEANPLAIYLHDHHPRTAHPAKPTAIV